MIRYTKKGSKKMGRIGLTYKAVADAAEQLVSEGERASIANIRQVLGTGSPNTIHRHLTAWRLQQPAAQASVVELPADLQNALVTEIERQAKQARDAVQLQLDALRCEAQTLAEAGEALEDARDALQSENDALQMQLVELRALITDRDRLLEISKTENKDLHGQIVKRERENADLAARLETRGQIENLTAQLEAAKK